MIFGSVSALSFAYRSGALSLAKHRIAMWATSSVVMLSSLAYFCRAAQVSSSIGILFLSSLLMFQTSVYSGVYLCREKLFKSCV